MLWIVFLMHCNQITCQLKGNNPPSWDLKNFEVFTCSTSFVGSVVRISSMSSETHGCAEMSKCAASSTVICESRRAREKACACWDLDSKIVSVYTFGAVEANRFYFKIFKITSPWAAHLSWSMLVKRIKAHRSKIIPHKTRKRDLHRCHSSRGGVFQVKILVSVEMSLCSTDTNSLSASVQVSWQLLSFHKALEFFAIFNQWLLQMNHIASPAHIEICRHIQSEQKFLILGLGSLRKWSIRNSRVFNPLGD